MRILFAVGMPPCDLCQRTSAAVFGLGGAPTSEFKAGAPPTALMLNPEMTRFSARRWVELKEKNQG